MMIKFGESTHPVFRATSPFSRGTLKCKGGGKLIYLHFSADGDTIGNCFSHKSFLLNQLSIYGAVSDLCEEYSSLSNKNWETSCGRAIRPIFRASRLIDNDTHILRLKFLHKKFCCRSTRNEWKGFHNQID